MRLLVLALALSLTGCGNTQPGGESNVPPPKTEVKPTKDGKQETVTSVPD